MVKRRVEKGYHSETAIIAIAAEIAMQEAEVLLSIPAAADGRAGIYLSANEIKRVNKTMLQI